MSEIIRKIITDAGPTGGKVDISPIEVIARAEGLIAEVEVNLPVLDYPLKVLDSEISVAKDAFNTAEEGFEPIIEKLKPIKDLCDSIDKLVRALTDLGITLEDYGDYKNNARGSIEGPYVSSKSVESEYTGMGGPYDVTQRETIFCDPGKMVGIKLVEKEYGSPGYPSFYLLYPDGKSTMFRYTNNYESVDDTLYVIAAKAIGLWEILGDRWENIPRTTKKPIPIATQKLFDWGK